MENHPSVSDALASNDQTIYAGSVSPLEPSQHSRSWPLSVTEPNNESSEMQASTDRYTHHGPPGEDHDTPPSQHSTSDTSESWPGADNTSDKSTTVIKSGSNGPWRPKYLQKRKLVVFPILFLGIIVAIQVLVRASQNKDGLATPSKKTHYIWTFGPMVILTLVAAFWARAEFQLKSVAPWIHMVDGQSFQRTLLLDYLAMLQPVAIVKAVKYRDWAVAAASFCSLLLRITVILSTALLVLTPTEIHNTSVPVQILSRFVDNTTELDGLATRLGSLPFFSMLGLSERNMSFPDGASKIYSFQQFVRTEVPDAHLKVSVEGFMSYLTCQPAALNTTYKNCRPRDSSNFCWALETEDCQYPIYEPPPVGQEDGPPPRYFGNVGLSGCNGSELASDIVLYIMFGRLNFKGGKPDYDISGFSQSAQVVCQASYRIDTVDVISNQAGVINISKAETSPSRQIDQLTEGKMLELYLMSFATRTNPPSPPIFNITGEKGELGTVQSDIIFKNAIDFTKSNPLVSNLLDESFLGATLNSHYQQNAVFIARSVFSARTFANTTGKLDLKKDRLVVSAATGHAITAILSAALILAILVIYNMPELPILPKSPSSIIGTIQLLADSRELLGLFSGVGPASLATLKNRLRDFHCRSIARQPTPGLQNPSESFRISVEPNQHLDELHYLDAPTNRMKASLVLNPIIITMVQAFIIGVIVSLEAILRVSGANNDFVDVSDQQYLHLTWTILPALLMSLVSMYFTAVDMEIRSLTPFSKLSKGASLSQMVGLDLLDGLLPRLLWREYRTECLAALTTTLCLLVSSLLTIFVGSLYNIVTLPTNTKIELQTDSSFIIANTSADGQVSDLGRFPDFSSITTTLILQNNLSYPSFTYETLAFPEFSVSDTRQDYRILPSDVVNATVPALRSRMTCTRYSSSEIQMDVQSASIPGVPASHQSKWDVLAINIDGQEHQSHTIPGASTHNVELPIDRGGGGGSDWVFGVGESCISSVGILWCSSDFLYVWGRKTDSADQSRSHVAALVCNESIEAVDASTTFFGPELRIDPAYPPRPINDSARASTVDVRAGSEHWLSPYVYLSEGVEAPGSYLLPFFNLLTTSRYGIPLADLEDADRDEAVARAIVFQHGVIRAQVLNEGFRGPADTANATLANPPADPAEANDARAYAATATAGSNAGGGRRRLAQDYATTRVVQALLGAALLLSSAARLLMPRAGLLPRDPTGIANVAALVADGNVLSALPENAQLLSDADLVAAGRGAYILRLGWWASGKGAAGARQRFGIFAVQTSQESVFD
ncbi:hypothetical protein SAMD00023353_2200110 [Rosellinia necatrix]|uniref:Uncharacterized protein n=1 Tax=Rosellinia necatrix TaxID=77044 RepID=A0A1S7UU53_ROSNE|nr:hypothetical protein SAMD00023353_2200110 [Rosellinia necatrix]